MLEFLKSLEQKIKILNEEIQKKNTYVSQISSALTKLKADKASTEAYVTNAMGMLQGFIDNHKELSAKMGISEEPKVVESESKQEDVSKG